MGLFAVRRGDPCTCIRHDHFPAPAAPPPRTVRVNGRTVVVQSDTCGCREGPAMVAVGSGTVRVNRQGMARCHEFVVMGGGHSGFFASGSPNVRVGGPGVVGPMGRFLRICAGLPAGRVAGRLCEGFTREHYAERMKDPTYVPPKLGLNENLQHQSVGNCGPETARQLIQAQGEDEGDAHKASLGETELYERLLATPRKSESTEGLIHEVTPDEYYGANYVSATKSGGMKVPEYRKTLDLYGIDNEEVRWNADDIGAVVTSGRPATLFLRPPYDGSPALKGVSSHVVLVIGAEYDAAGNVTAFYVNDTAQGTCGVRVPADLVMKAQHPFGGVVAPTSPMW